MLEHLKYHCKHNETKPNGSVAITVAAFDTESAAIEFVKNNPQYDIDEVWFMENQDGTWVPIKTVWTKGSEQWAPESSDVSLGKWKKTTTRDMTGEIDAYRCSLCGGVCQWKHKVCPICKGEMNMDD